MLVYLLSHEKQIGSGLLLIFCVNIWQIPQQVLNEYMVLISHDQISVASGETGVPCQMFVRPTKKGLHSSTSLECVSGLKITKEVMYVPSDH